MNYFNQDHDNPALNAYTDESAPYDIGQLTKYAKFVQREVR